MESVAVGFSIGFAVAIVVVAASFAAAAGNRLPMRTASILAGVIGSAAVAAWIALAFDPELALAVAAAGLTVCAFAELGASALSRLVGRGRELDADFARAEAQLRALIEQEAAERAVELERTLARARADSVSELTEQERRIAEERRVAFIAREAGARDELAAALSAAQQQVERRFAEWAQDLERIQEQLAGQISRIGERQREVIEKVESRLDADAERIAGGERRAARVRRAPARGARPLTRRGRADGERRARVAGRRPAPSVARSRRTGSDAARRRCASRSSARKRTPRSGSRPGSGRSSESSSSSSSV